MASLLRFWNLPQAPPGLHYDEAANGVLAAEIGTGISRPIFIPSYTGKEVLFFYLAGGLMRLAGRTIFILRVTSALLGVITIAAAYWLGQELFRDRRIALLAAALLAVSFWHLIFSRLGFRAVTQPLLQALTAAALMRGIRRQDRGWLLAAGVFLGLTAYTYLAARLFPVLVLLAVLPFLLNRRTFRRRLSQLSVAALTAFIVALPLFYFFWNHPEAFWVRINQVAPDAANRLPLAESIRLSLAMFFLRGDPYLRFNIPYQPLFNWFWGGLAAGAWAALIIKFRRNRHDWERTAVLWLILAPLIMILPTALATNEIVPSNLRAIGLLPFVYFLPAWGFWALADFIRQRFSWEQLPRFLAGLFFLWLLAAGAHTSFSYFRTWANQPALFYESDGDLTAAANFLNGLDTKGKTIYMAAPYYQHPTLAFLSPLYDQIKWLPQSQAIVFPAEGAADYLFPNNSPLPEWAGPFLNTAVPLGGSPDLEGMPAFSAYELPAPPAISIPHPTAITFGGAITLLGYDIGKIEANKLVSLILYWRVLNQPAGNFTPVVHLLDPWQNRWAQEETTAYPSAQWQPGETVVQQVNLAIDPGAPPGAYQLRIGVFSPETGERLPRVDANGRYAGDGYLIKDVILPAGPPPPSLPHPPNQIGERVAPGLTLVGTGPLPPEIETGAPLTIPLWWLSNQQLPHLSTRLILQSEISEPIVLTTTNPVYGTLPFNLWPSPIFLIDHLQSQIPVAAQAGEYTLLLAVLDNNRSQVYQQVLGRIQVQAGSHLFEAPAIQTAIDAAFGNEITLLGTNLFTNQDGQIELRLIWQAGGPIALDYTVFVHLLDQEGICCLWQADVMPQQNQYPTSRWLPGEVVIDPYAIILPDDLAPGVYKLEVGLYIAENGRRLQVSSPDFGNIDAVYIDVNVGQ